MPLVHQASDAATAYHHPDSYNLAQAQSPRKPSVRKDAVGQFGNPIAISGIVCDRRSDLAILHQLDECNAPNEMGTRSSSATLSISEMEQSASLSHMVASAVEKCRIVGATITDSRPVSRWQTSNARRRLIRCDLNHLSNAQPNMRLATYTIATRLTAVHASSATRTLPRMANASSIAILATAPCFF